MLRGSEVHVEQSTNYKDLEYTLTQLRLAILAGTGRPGERGGTAEIPETTKRKTNILHAWDGVHNASNTCGLKLSEQKVVPRYETCPR